MGQGPYPHHEKFLQVGLIYPQESQPLQQGHGGVPRLHKHPKVKLQPAQLPVHEAVLYLRPGPGQDGRLPLPHSFSVSSPCFPPLFIPRTM